MGASPRTGANIDPEIIVINGVLPVLTAMFTPPQGNTRVIKVQATGGGSTIQSIQRGGDGQRVLFLNVDPVNAVNFTSQSGLGDLAGQLFIPSLSPGSSYSLKPFGSIVFYFDSDLLGWLGIAGFGSGAAVTGFSGASVVNSVDQAIPSATQTNLNFDTVLYDTAGFHGGAHPDRLTIPSTGYYLVTFTSRPNNAGPPTIYYNLTLNNVTSLATNSTPANAVADGGGCSLTYEGHFNTGDFLTAGYFATGPVSTDHTMTTFSISSRGV